MAARVGVAAGSRLGTQAAANVACNGGNAIDACLASAIMGWVAEPFFASLGGAGFIAIRTPQGTVEIVDGNNAVPSVGADPGVGMRRVFFADYADGMYTGVGGGSVAVPGILAAVRAAWESHGRIEWAALFEDAIAAARDGIAFPRTSGYYLSVTWEPLWSRFESSRSVFGIDGRPIGEGERFVQPELAESLELVAKRGPEAFYGGELGDQVIETIGRDGGQMTLDDLKSYRAGSRLPLATEAFGWRVETNPPPAVGGAVLTHMLALLASADVRDLSQRLRQFVEAQRVATAYRRERYQDPTSIAAAFQEAIEGLGPASGETTHSSTADSEGFVCSLTESNGYGAGLLAGGILLNNTLGEEELNPLGVDRLVPGSPCLSNMTPTIALGPDRIVALGSPGADRIVGAIVQAFLRIAVDGDGLADAVAAPRAHLDPRAEGETLCFEPGLPGEVLQYRLRPYEEPHMYFGAVQAASVSSDGTVDAAHDPRRSGGSALV